MDKNKPADDWKEFEKGLGESAEHLLTVLSIFCEDRDDKHKNNEMDEASIVWKEALEYLESWGKEIKEKAETEAIIFFNK